MAKNRAKSFGEAPWERSGEEGSSIDEMKYEPEALATAAGEGRIRRLRFRLVGVARRLLASPSLTLPARNCESQTMGGPA